MRFSNFFSMGAVTAASLVVSALASPSGSAQPAVSAPSSLTGTYQPTINASTSFERATPPARSNTAGQSVPVYWSRSAADRAADSDNFRSRPSPPPQDGHTWSTPEQKFAAARAFLNSAPYHSAVGKKRMQPSVARRRAAESTAAELSGYNGQLPLSSLPQAISELERRLNILGAGSQAYSSTNAMSSRSSSSASGGLGSPSASSGASAGGSTGSSSGGYSNNAGYSSSGRFNGNGGSYSNSYSGNGGSFGGSSGYYGMNAGGFGSNRGYGSNYTGTMYLGDSTGFFSRSTWYIGGDFGLYSGGYMFIGGGAGNSNNGYRVPMPTFGPRPR